MSTTKNWFEYVHGFGNQVIPIITANILGFIPFLIYFGIFNNIIKSYLMFVRKKYASKEHIPF
jgi:hypothetical protein